MGGFRMEDSSIPARMGEAERSLHTLQFRVDHLDAQRLPDRLAGMESTMLNVQRDLTDLRATAHHTNDLVSEIRMELTQDLGKMEDVFLERTYALKTAIDKLTTRIVATVATATVILGVVAWAVEHFNVISAVAKAFAAN